MSLRRLVAALLLLALVLAAPRALALQPVVRVLPGMAPFPSGATGLVIHVRGDLQYNAGTGAWTDQSSGGHNLASSASKPTAVTTCPNGLAGVHYTAASSQYHLATFTLNQPTYVWIVAAWTTTWASNREMLDGSSLNHGSFFQWAAPSVELYAASGLAVSGESPLNFQAWGLTINGSSSAIASNDTTEISGAAGANNPGGVTLGAFGGGGGNFADLTVCELAEFTTAPGFAVGSALSNYRRSRYGF